MEKIELKNNILKFEKRLKKGETYKVIKSRKFFTISVFGKPLTVSGIASSCEDGKEVLFIDYDNCEKRVIVKDYQLIQEENKLPPGYLFQTKKGNFHVICLKKFYVKEIFNIIAKTHCDVNYVSMPLRNKYRNWVLRISNKGKRNGPRFIEIIGEHKNLNYEVSKPHIDFLNKIHKLPKLNYRNLDSCNKIYLQEYETMNI